ncbi:dipeptidase, partial [Corynebacterium bovis]
DPVNAVPAEAAAVVHLRVPPGTDPTAAQDALVRHLEANVPLHARLTVERGEVAAPFSADLTGPALATLSDALADAYGRDTDPGVETVHIASGGSIPLCTSLLARHPDAELALFGVEEPACRIHSSDESVDPTEIHAIGTAELLFLARTAAAGR